MKIIFEDLFNQSKGQPFVYNDKLICLSDKTQLVSKVTMCSITFISIDSEWRQGIVLNTKGDFEINGQKLPNKIVLWYDTAPKEVLIKINSSNKLLLLYNVWDTGNGTIQYGHNGAGMHIEEKEGYKIYHCNDGVPDDDLNDLIFTVQYQ